MRKVALLITSCCFAAVLNAASTPFPTGLVPFNSIANETTNANGDVLVLGYTNVALLPALNAIPFPSSQKEMFSPSSIELAPGRFFSDVFVPTPAQRVGIFSAFGAPLIDPLTGQPFRGNSIPSSRLFGNNGLFAFEVGPQAAAIPEPSTAYLMLGALFSIAFLWIAKQRSKTTD